MESIDDALYNCNWMDAPLKMKKLILIYKIRFAQQNVVMGGPFYICNIELFGDVSFILLWVTFRIFWRLTMNLYIYLLQIIKRTYYLLTLLLDRIK